MTSMVTLRRRIKSVRSTHQITKAMELISASKMRRANELSHASRYYTDTAQQLLARLRHITDTSHHPLYVSREVRSRLYIVITSNKGLNGAYSKNVLHEFTQCLYDDINQGVVSRVILIGRQAGRFASRLKALDIVGLYDNLPERAAIQDLLPLIGTAIDLFCNHDKQLRVDQVKVLSTRNVSNLEQRVVQMVLLPVGEPSVSIEDMSEQEVLFEPSSQEVLEVATRRCIEMILLQAYLESQASEQSARMLAMKTASDNATNIIDDLVLLSNTTRQAMITRELAEITNGAGALL